MKFPIIELVDRYAIAVVKSEKTNGQNIEELNFYTEQINEVRLDLDDPTLLELIEHHRFVWSLEDDFKKCRVDNLPLEEIGRRALIVRDAGNNRVILKNKLAAQLNDPVSEVKKYYQ